ncbi:hypothetical protein [Rathayibacter sp. AY1C6]|uniref:hypothetical protein n=1 Tax=Rathayibacter sp. AY1C6 TaxID=2080539 RepID=UPI0011B090BC|nr:hypothetical protein [Rathayibacter sp. AY1C6]
MTEIIPPTDEAPIPPGGASSADEFYLSSSGAQILVNRSNPLGVGGSSRAFPAEYRLTSEDGAAWLGDARPLAVKFVPTPGEAYMGTTDIPKARKAERAAYYRIARSLHGSGRGHTLMHCFDVIGDPDAIEQDKTCGFVLERAGVSVKTYLDRVPDEYVDVYVAIVVVSAYRALIDLDSIDISHRDLTPSNLFVPFADKERGSVLPHSVLMGDFSHAFVDGEEYGDPTTDGIRTGYPLVQPLDRWSPDSSKWRSHNGLPDDLFSLGATAHILLSDDFGTPFTLRGERLHYKEQPTIDPREVRLEPEQRATPDVPALRQIVDLLLIEPGPNAQVDNNVGVLVDELRTQIVQFMAKHDLHDILFPARYAEGDPRYGVLKSWSAVPAPRARRAPRGQEAAPKPTRTSTKFSVPGATTMNEPTPPAPLPPISARTEWWLSRVVAPTLGVVIAAGISAWFGSIVGLEPAWLVQWFPLYYVAVAIALVTVCIVSTRTTGDYEEPSHSQIWTGVARLTGLAGLAVLAPVLAMALVVAAFSLLPTANPAFPLWDWPQWFAWLGLSAVGFLVVVLIVIATDPAQRGSAVSWARGLAVFGIFILLITWAVQFIMGQAQPGAADVSAACGATVLRFTAPTTRVCIPAIDPWLDLVENDEGATVGGSLWTEAGWPTDVSTTSTGMFVAAARSTSAPCSTVYVVAATDGSHSEIGPSAPNVPLYDGSGALVMRAALQPATPVGNAGRLVLGGRPFAVASASESTGSGVSRISIYRASVARGLLIEQIGGTDVVAWSEQRDCPAAQSEAIENKARILIGTIQITSDKRIDPPLIAVDVAGLTSIEQATVEDVIIAQPDGATVEPAPPLTAGVIAAARLGLKGDDSIEVRFLTYVPDFVPPGVVLRSVRDWQEFDREDGSVERLAIADVGPHRIVLDVRVNPGPDGVFAPRNNALIDKIQSSLVISPAPTAVGAV